MGFKVSAAVKQQENETNSLSKLVRSQSISCFKRYGQFKDVTLHTPDLKAIPIYAHWMSLILLATDQVQLVIKVHFNDSDIEKLLQMRYRSKRIEHEREVLDSFVNELLNLIGVNIKNTLNKVGIHVGMSLPIVTRGFDNYFFEANLLDHELAGKSSVEQIIDIWKVSVRDDAAIFFSFDADIISKNILQNIDQLGDDLLMQDDEDTENDLEFL